MGCAGIRRKDPCQRLSSRDLTAGEFELFVSNLSCGLALPISSFFVLLLEEIGLQPQHLTPCFILQAAIIATTTQNPI
jgi:hypothetical protein